MGAALAGFAAFASAEVLVRLALDGNLADRSEHVLLPLAFAALSASLCALGVLAALATRSKRFHARPQRRLRRQR